MKQQHMFTLKHAACIFTKRKHSLLKFNIYISISSRVVIAVFPLKTT